MRLLFLLFICVHCVASYNVLVYICNFGKSHIQYVSLLIDKLVDHGHTVDLINAKMNSLVTSRGSKKTRRTVTVEFDGISPWNKGGRHLIEPFKDHQRWQDAVDPKRGILNTVTAQLCDLVLNSTEVRDLLTTEKYDVALISPFDLCPHALAHRYNITRVATYSATPAVKNQLDSSGTPSLPLYENNIFDARVDSDRSLLWRRLADYCMYLMDSLRNYSHQQFMTEKFRSHFGPSFPTAQELFAKTAAFDFTNTHALLDEPAPVSNKLKYIGGVGLPQPKPLDERFDAMLNISKKGTIIFSFGTQVPDVPPHVVRIFSAAFKHFPEHTFIWKVNSTEPFDAPNIIGVDWLPQTDLLYDDRVVSFISHMGLNSFNELAFAGKSVLAVPLFGDQFHNARCVRRLGTGVIVDKRALSVDAVVAALTDVLSPKFVNRAREVAQMLAQYDDSTRTFIDTMEFLAQFENFGTHLNLAGAEYNILVSNGWDVILLFASTAATLFIIITMLFFVITRKILHVLRSSMIKTKIE